MPNYNLPEQHLKILGFELVPTGGLCPHDLVAYRGGVGIVGNYRHDGKALGVQETSNGVTKIYEVPADEESIIRWAAEMAGKTADDDQ